MKTNNITKEVEYGRIEGNTLPILKCICGEEFSGWHFFLVAGSIVECPAGYRKMTFEYQIKISEVIDE